MASKNKRSDKTVGFMRAVCIAAAAVIASGIVTIGMMNLICTDELYTAYTSAVSLNSVICGLIAFAFTAALTVLMYMLLKFKPAMTAVIALALAARTAAALFWRIEPQSDFLITYELGKLIAHEPIARWGAALDGYGTTYNTIWAAHMPFVVYESLLLKISESTLILKLANALFSFGGFILTIRTAMLIGGKKACRAAAAFTALNPVMIFFVPVLTNQHAAQFFFLLGVYLFFQLRPNNLLLGAVLAGFCGGVSHLLRPELWVVVISLCVFSLYIALRSRSMRGAAVFAAGLCVFIAVTAAMNTFLTSADVIHGSIYRSNLNYKIMTGLNPETKGSWSGTDSALEGNDRAINTVIRSRLRDNPLKLVPRLYGKAVYQLGTYVYTWSFREDSIWVSQVIMRRCGAALMLIVCAMTVFKLFKRRRELEWLYITLLCYAAVYALIEVQGRYSFTFIPMLVLIAAV